MKKITLAICLLVLSLSLNAQTIVRTQVSSNPSGATFAVDGNVIGQTPMQFRMRDGQAYQVVFTLAGYKTLTVIHTGGKGDVNVNLESEITNFNFNIKGNVAGADVYLNEQPSGKIPMNIAVKPGSYTVKVVAPGYKTAYQSVQISSNNSIFVQMEQEKFIKLTIPPRSQVWINGAEHGTKGQNNSFTTLMISAPAGSTGANVKVKYYDLIVEKYIEFSTQNVVFGADLK
ncbi:MAG: hypothetical protein A2015_04910 [Spirochaetes bacterium GWF1_31_7]|nr:MAG: hypothetical protein A2Y30_05280 [Spirochaetes bacterium GWE1_32_154]OHD48806.1 MAG: hypothetical protein A2Y29_03260 [Spirochaetes bacterium GWE2_31_10]OHD52868.1 MAG: hypothetical protein A2015_04910 [Spirochaetes bacterium GWF1_31_7]OHD82060.1 MAG: hypothetical protein A2355_16285 [Spirochaetes bacterium RIFOXYB1_FULL_32_8]HBD94680.1 hypothetical protein [Spirochaetia bacterium]